jgi:SAM-dependent methyltransferase
MSVSAHLGIRLDEYDARIRTFIPRYEAMLDAAAAALQGIGRPSPLIVDLGIGTGALAAQCLRVVRNARVVGIDNDERILAMAHKRIGRRLATIAGDMLTTPLPRCDVVMASFAFHHISTRRRKAALYARCSTALRRGGVLVNADCCLSSSPRLREEDRSAWLAHIGRSYGARRATQFLRTWAKEDVYLPLAVEINLLTSAGFTVDVPWRRGCFAVVVGSK